MKYYWITFIVTLFLVILTTMYFLYIHPSCTTGNLVVDPNLGTCSIAVTQCTGFACDSPIMTIQCEMSKEICGETLFCDCL